MRSEPRSRLVFQIKLCLWLLGTTRQTCSAMLKVTAVIAAQWWNRSLQTCQKNVPLSERKVGHVMRKSYSNNAVSVHYIKKKQAPISQLCVGWQQVPRMMICQLLRLHLYLNHDVRHSGLLMGAVIILNNRNLLLAPLYTSACLSGAKTGAAWCNVITVLCETMQHRPFALPSAFLIIKTGDRLQGKAFIMCVRVHEMEILAI